MPNRLEWGEMLSKGIMAITPKYENGLGDTTDIVICGGGIYKIPKNIGTVLKNLGKYMMVDLAESKRYYSEYLGKRKNIPMVYDPENIYIVVKTRFPIGKNDGAMSYVNHRFVDNVKDSDIYLTGGDMLETFTSNTTISKNLLDAKYILRDIEARYGK